MTVLQAIEHTLVLGVGATAMLDAWQAVLARFGVPASDYGLVGRWVGQMPGGRFTHAAIARAQPVRGERALGWAVHVATGLVFAAVFVAWQGGAWLQRPTPGPALAFGLVTVAAPLLVMQPAMGAGIAASRTATPARNVLRSVGNHVVFGLGLYLAARLAVALSP